MTEPPTSEEPAQQIVYELYSNNLPGRDGSLMQGVLLALKHRLYVPSIDFCMREEFVDLKHDKVHTETTNDHHMVLAKDTQSGKYVCCLYLRVLHMQAFTRKAYRKRGIAKAAVKRFGELPEGVYALSGIKGAYLFWEKAGIKSSRW